MALLLVEERKEPNFEFTSAALETDRVAVLV